MGVIENHARARLTKGELAVSFNVVHWRTGNIAALAEELGYDWLFIDMEHGTLDLDTVAQICVAALPTGVTPIVRVPSEDHFHASRVLDGGAMGVIVPHISTPAAAREVVSNCKFPPIGHRSVASNVPQLGFKALPKAEACEVLNRNLLVIVMLESPEAIANADAIVATPGIDGVLIGTNDLAAEMGIAGQLDHPKIEEAYELMIAACQRHGKIPGMGGIYAPPLMEKMIRKGVRFLQGGGDLTFMVAAARQRIGFLRGINLADGGTAPVPAE